MALVCTLLAAAAHVHSPAHSPRYLLFLLIFSFPTLLISLLAFLVDILLFVPHLQWGGWIVLASTIIICGCSVLTCAMRRTLVSRKARKKRIAENADMNGENAFQASTQPPPPQYAADIGLGRADSPPPMNTEAKLPNFTTYDAEKPRLSSDDRTPLNSNSRDPSIRTQSSRGTNRRRGGPDPYHGTGPMHRGPSSGRDGRNSPVSPIEYDGSDRDQRYYAGPGPRGGRGRPPPPPFQRGRGGPPRGGYPPARGGYPPRGTPNIRAGPPPRAAYQAGRPPPPGWGGDRGYRPMAAGAMMNRGPGPRGESYVDEYYFHPPAQNPYSQPAQNYYEQPAQQHGYGDMAGSNPYGPPSADDRRPSDNSFYPEGAGYGAAAVPYERRPSQGQRTPPNFSRSSSLARNTSPHSQTRQREPSPPPPMPQMTSEQMPIGQAVEMDAASGSPAQSPVGRGGPISPLDGPTAFAPVELNGSSSEYSLPPRLSPLTSTDLSSLNRSTSPLQPVIHPIELGENTPRLQKSNLHSATKISDPPPVELPGSQDHLLTSSTAVDGNKQSHHQPRGSSDNYYEDVDPRWAHQEQQQLSQEQPVDTAAVPPSLMPAAGYLHPSRADPYGRKLSDNSSHYSDLQPPGALSGSDPTWRARSPAHSDTSNFTSVSQRGINPEWAASQRGPPGAYGSGSYYGGGSGVGGHGRNDSPKRYRPQDAILADNPEFSVPGMSAPGSGHVGHAHKRSGSRPTARLGGDGGMQGGPYPGM